MRALLVALLVVVASVAFAANPKVRGKPTGALPTAGESAADSAAGGASGAEWSIVLIISDDSSWVWTDLRGFTSPYGDERSVVAMPNLDTLQDEGITFTRFHSNETCAPSKLDLLTGITHYKAGSGETTAPNEFVTFGTVLDSALTLGAFGKLGTECSTGQCSTDATTYGDGSVTWVTEYDFDRVEANVPDGAINWGHYEWNVSDKTPLGLTDEGTTGTAPTGSDQFLPERTVDEFIEWQATLGANERYFAWVHFQETHGSEYVEPGLPGARPARPWDINATDCTNGAGTGAQACFENQMNDMDTYIGDVYAAVDLDTTFIFWMSDDGTEIDTVNVPGSPTGGKNDPEEAGVRLPMIIRVPNNYPGRLAGVVVDQLVEAIDLPYTFAALSGKNMPSTYASAFPTLGGTAIEAHHRGKDLSSIFADRTADLSRRYVAEHSGDGRVWDSRSDWKLVMDLTPGLTQLIYHLPTETAESTHARAAQWRTHLFNRFFHWFQVDFTGIYGVYDINTSMDEDDQVVEFFERGTDCDDAANYISMFQATASGAVDCNASAVTAPEGSAYGTVPAGGWIGTDGLGHLNSDYSEIDFYFRADDVDGSSRNWGGFWDAAGSVEHVNWRTSSSGTFDCRVAVSAPTDAGIVVLSADTWYKIRARYFPSTDTVTCWIDPQGGTWGAGAIETVGDDSTDNNNIVGSVYFNGVGVTTLLVDHVQIRTYPSLEVEDGEFRCDREGSGWNLCLSFEQTDNYDGTDCTDLQAIGYLVGDDTACQQPTVLDGTYQFQYPSGSGGDGWWWDTVDCAGAAGTVCRLRFKLDVNNAITASVASTALFELWSASTASQQFGLTFQHAANTLSTAVAIKGSPLTTLVTLTSDDEQFKVQIDLDADAEKVTVWMDPEDGTYGAGESNGGGTFYTTTLMDPVDEIWIYERPATEVQLGYDNVLATDITLTQNY